jgi:hypothetical protein
MPKQRECGLPILGKMPKPLIHLGQDAQATKDTISCRKSIKGIMGARETILHNLEWLWLIMGLWMAVEATAGLRDEGMPQTRAEQTDYRQTSSYTDVIAFLDALQQRGASIQVQYIGESPQGKRIPLVIAAKPLPASPAAARRSGKPIVYIQANIHAGEVEGKEAVLTLLRDLSQKDKDRLLERLILLITPIYNIDGNEKLGDVKRNRPEQDGPDPVGERTNGQGFDLNRDCIKAESNEMRAVLEHVYTSWDPDVVMDLHTTNGTRHGFHLTYSPPLNPNTDPEILKYTRDELLPGLRKSLKKSHGQELFDYGNAEGRGAERAWRTFGAEGRYVTNYVGLRNRIAVLSEATSYLPFKIRIESTYWFVEGVLRESARNAGRIVKLTREADARVIQWGQDPQNAPVLGVRFSMASRGTETIPLEKRLPGVQIDPSKAPDALETVSMPVYDRFIATRSAKFPTAYLIPASAPRVVELLQRHGIVVEKLKTVWQGDVEAFTLSEVQVNETPFQGHRLIRLEGNFAKESAHFLVGSYLVRTSQPLGALAFHILEPESLDGAAAWEFFDGSFAAGNRYPVVKVFAPVYVPTERVGSP